jgi:hypothetical protein
MSENVTQTPAPQNPAFAGHAGLSCKGHFDAVTGSPDDLDEEILGIDQVNLILQSGNKAGKKVYNTNREQDEDSEENREIAQSKAAAKMAKMANSFSNISTTPYDKAEVFNHKGHELNFWEVRQAASAASKDIDKKIQETSEEMIIEDHEIAKTASGTPIPNELIQEKIYMRTGDKSVFEGVTLDQTTVVDGQRVSKEGCEKLAALETEAKQMNQFTVKAQSLAQQVTLGKITAEEAQAQLTFSTDSEIMATVADKHEELDQNLPTDMAQAAEIHLESSGPPLTSQPVNNVVADVSYAVSNTLKPTPL